MLQPEHLKLIGGSDIAAIIGISPYANETDVYMRIKYGQTNETKSYMDVGTFIEDGIANLFEHYTGIKTYKSDTITVNNWARVSPDRLLHKYNHSEPVDGLEIKNVGMQMLSAWGADEIPDYYYVQVQWYMKYFQSNIWHVAALLGGNSFRQFEIQPNNELQVALWDTARQWYDRYIIGLDVPPNAPGSKRYLIRIYPENNDIIRNANATESAMLERLFVLKQAKSELDERIKTVELSVKNIIGLDEGIKSRTLKATWKHEGSKGRVLRIKEL